MSHEKLENCPSCGYVLIERTTYCPFCRVQLTSPPWKKAGAWILLLLILYLLVRCNLEIIDGFEAF